MLVVLFGVSCVGKTTIIEKLITQGCLPIRVYTTRPLRKGEIVKIHLSEENFDEYQNQHRFAWTNQFFNTKYGTSQEDISQALSSPDVYLLDYSLSRKKDFDHIDCKKIIILPESIEALSQQVKSANREDRISEIFCEYESYYSTSAIEEYLHQGFISVTNYYQFPQKAIDDIKSYILVGGKYGGSK